MQTKFKINKQRLNSRIAELSAIGVQSNSGVTRLALTKEDFLGQEIVSKWMEQAGMKVYRDNFGNLIGRKEGAFPNRPVIMLGSHIDSVPNGGRFDGTIGVISAIEVVEILNEHNIVNNSPIEVVAFCDEEGSRFTSGMFGSRGMAGLVTNDDLLLKDNNGITRYQAMQDFGLDVKNLSESIREKGSIEVFLEMHIEQGPYLESINCPAGIVTGIAGPNWYRVKIKGEAGHAGTVPMHLRKDALAGAAEIITFIEESCSDINTDTVGTVGKIYSHPGSVNVIPNIVEFSMDIRDIDLNRREKVTSAIKEKIEEVCKNRKLSYEISEELNLNPTFCAENVIKKMSKASQKMGLDLPMMVSGASHDTMVISKMADVGLIFVRCKDGISHNPKEWAEVDDIAVGTTLLLEVLSEYL